MNPNRIIEKDSLFARRMRSLYSRCAYERKELAQSLNVTVHTVQQWETGEKVPDVNQLRAIAKLVGMPCDWFLLDDSDKGVSDQEVDWIADRLGIAPETVDLIVAATMGASEDVCYAFDVQLRGAAASIVLMELEHRLENSAQENDALQQAGTSIRFRMLDSALIGNS